jgi:hypothetical protein
LTILLAGERFDRAAALFETVDEAGAWNDTTRYLVAHACLQTGEIERAEQLYRAIQDEGLRTPADQMLETIASMKTTSRMR